MIIDRTALAGDIAYIWTQKGSVDLLSDSEKSGITRALQRGEQWVVSSLEFLIEAKEGSDLAALFSRQGDPLIAISVQKELFRSYFADPFCSRVYNVAGVDDFKRGEATGCRILEVQGVPTIVSLGGVAEPTWRSSWFELPLETEFKAVCWELATSRSTPDTAFTYSISVHVRDRAGTERSVSVAKDFTPSAARCAFPIELTNVASFRVELTAKVVLETELYEHHASLLSESVGQPLLRAVNLVERVPSQHEFRSLAELQTRCSDFVRFEERSGRLQRITASLELPATLVHSDQQDLASGKHEFIKVKILAAQFSRIEVRLCGEQLLRIPRA